MQRVILLFVSLFFFMMLFSVGLNPVSGAESSQSASSQSPPSSGKTPSISVPESTYDFGEVAEDGIVSHDFIVKNTGLGPLEINQVRPG